MGKLTFILGGVRSGKSSYAEQLAAESGGDSVLYLATSEAKDEEMAARVEKHRASRPASWATLEAPLNVAKHLTGYPGRPQAVLVDCLTLLVTNVLMATTDPGEDVFGAPAADPFSEAIEARVVAEVEALADYAEAHDTHVIVVSNEVGMGVVPAYELGRAYRDLLGRANQRMAARADSVYLLVAGIPVTVK